MDLQKLQILKTVFEKQGLRYFSDIFLYISMSWVADELGVNYTRFTSLVKNPTGFKYSETQKISKITGIPHRFLSELIHNQLEAGPKANRKRMK